MRRWAATVVLTVGGALLAGGCGLNVQLADLFLLTRTGQGSNLTMLVNASGQITCNGGKQKTLSSALVIQSRSLASGLAKDAKRHLDLPPKPGTVFSYKLKLQQGTIRFSDRDTLHHPLLAQVELFTAQAAQQACGLAG